MSVSKIAIIGVGAVGSTIAYTLLLKNMATEIMLVDVDEVRCEGEVLDLADALLSSRTARIVKASFSQAAQADIIIICVGARQQVGQTRIELLDTNKRIISSLCSRLQPLNKSAIVIVVTNPVDIITYCVHEHMELPRNQIFGSGTFLDTQRLLGIIGSSISVSPQSIDAFVLGEHGDSQFVAWSLANVGGIPITSYPHMTAQELQHIEQLTKQRADEIISCKGATYFGIAACVGRMCEAIVFSQRFVFPLSTFHEEYKVCLSLPVVLGRNGIEKQLAVPLNMQEERKLYESAQVLQKTMDRSINV